jgi:hypothetical protein
MLTKLEINRSQAWKQVWNQVRIQTSNQLGQDINNAN